MLPHNALCMTCHQKNHSSKLHKLKIIYDYLVHKKYDLTDDKNKSFFNWAIKDHCKYGLDCHYLRNFERECRNYTLKIDPMLVHICRNQLKDDYRHVLKLLAGDFPSVYKRFERLYYEYVKNKHKGVTINGT